MLEKLSLSMIYHYHQYSIRLSDFPDCVVSRCWDQEPEVFWDSPHPIKGSDDHDPLKYIGDQDPTKGGDDHHPFKGGDDDVDHHHYPLKGSDHHHEDGLDYTDDNR